MTIDHLLAVVPVSDIDAGGGWYSSLFGRAPDNNPMPGLLEWQVRPGGWVQVFTDPERAGSGLLNFAVDDLEAAVAEIGARGVEAEPIVDAAKGVRLATLTDPDGNLLRLVGGFRVEY